MPEAANNEQQPPETTSTQAYVGNSVASVYMSFNRNDLLDAGEQVGDGFIGMSDPLGIRECLESFTFECSEGKEALLYKVKLLNPTTKIDEAFMGIFNSVYPQEEGVIGAFVDESVRQRSLEDVTGEASIEYQKLGAESLSPIPNVYVRWGYGDGEKTGISRIHKTKLTDIKYLINANQDKVVELTLADQLSFTKTSQVFTKRQHKGEITCLNKEGRLKRPGVMVQDLIAQYVSVYPEVTPVCNLYATPGDNDASFGHHLDSTFEGVALAMSLKAKEAWLMRRGANKASIGDNEGRKSVSDWCNSLSVEQRAQFESASGMAQIIASAEWKKDMAGVITDSIRLQAYKTCFEEIGLVFKSELLDPQTANVPGALSTEQISETPEIEGEPPGFTYLMRSQWADSSKEITVNLHDPEADFLDPPDLNHDWAHYKKGFLTFWPKTLHPRSDRLSEGRGLTALGLITDIDVSGIARSENRSYDQLDKQICITGSEGPYDRRYPKSYQMAANPTAVEHYGSLVVTFQHPIPDKYVIKYGGTLESTEGYPLSGNLFPGCVGTYVNLAPDIKDEAYNRDTKEWEKIEPVEFYDVPGTGELNNHSYYLYKPQKHGDWLDDNQYYLLSAIPAMDGISWLYDPELKPIGYWDVPDSVISSDHFGRYGGKLYKEENFGKIKSADQDEILTSEPAQGSPRQLRNLTLDEKKAAVENNAAPIWLKPGLVNMRHPVTATNRIDENRFTFSIARLERLFPRTKYFRAMHGLSPKTRYYAGLPQKYVMIPPPNLSGLWDIPIRTGKSPSPFKMVLEDTLGRDLETAKIPVYDIDTGELGLYSVVSGNPEGGDTLGQYTAPLNGYSENPKLINSSPVLLQPTADTYKYIMDLCWDLRAEVSRADISDARGQEHLKDLGMIEDQVTSPNTPPVESPPEEDKFLPPFDRGVFLSLGTNGIKPNITSTLQGLFNNLNNFVVGSPNKLRFTSLSFCQMSKSQQDAILEEGPLKNIDESIKTDFKEKNQMLALATCDKDIEKYTELLVNRVFSFPEITHKNHPAKIYLEYGTSKSIVKNIQFDAGMRYLLGIAQSSYMSRYFADIESYFSSERNQSQMIYKVISKGLQDKVALLEQKTPQDYAQDYAQDEYFVDDPATTTTEVNWELEDAIALQQKVGIDKNQIMSEGVISAEILDLFPAFANKYTDQEWAEVVGEESVKDLRLLTSLVNSPTFLNELFPNADIDTSNQELTNTAVKGDASGGAVAEKEVTKILRRKIDFVTASKRLSKTTNVADMRKIMDQSYWFKEALVDEAWDVTLDVLGIPEMDVLPVEVSQRIVSLQVYDARLGTNTLHWVSGEYRVTGFSHKISPSNGYTTSLKLMKIPTTKQNQLTGGLGVPKK